MGRIQRCHFFIYSAEYRRRQEGQVEAGLRHTVRLVCVTYRMVRELIHIIQPSQEDGKFQKTGLIYY